MQINKLFNSLAIKVNLSFLEILPIYIDTKIKLIVIMRIFRYENLYYCIVL